MVNENDEILFDNDMMFFDEEDDTEEKLLSPWKLLIVDDEEEVHNVTKLVLADFKFMNKSVSFLSAFSSIEAKEVIAANPDISVILLDVVMEADDAGLKLVKYIREYLGNHIVRIILRTGQPGYAPERNVIVDYDISDYKEKTELTVQKLFTTMVASLRTYDDISKIDYANKQLEMMNQEIEGTQKEILFTLGEIAEARSKETGNHVKRVAEYSYYLAKKYGLSEEEAEIIKMATPIHDIGKLAIPDNVLNKPAKLTNDEFTLMKTHAAIGEELLKNSERTLIKAAAIIAGEHHEKYNGKGYPRGISGEDIHIYGRIAAIADVFDALSSDRVYKKAWPIDQILSLFKEERGEHFDPKLTDIFVDNINDILEIRESLKDNFE